MLRLVVLSVIFVLALTASVNAASLKVVVNDVSPQPVEPGNDLTLRVTYTSMDESASVVSTRLDLRDPFVLKTSTEDYEKGFDLCAFCSRTNTYFIYVEPDAKSGIYPMFIRTSQSGSEIVRTVNVSVRGKPNIVLLSDSIINATPNDVFTMRLKASNIGTGNAKQIKIISKSTDFISLGSSVFTINSIEAGNRSSVSFFTAPDDDLKAGAYNIPFEINYIDESGAQYNSTQNVGVQVLNKGEISIENIKVASEIGTATAGSPISIIVRLENIGTGNADSVETEITCDSQKAKSFLGQLKRDEDVPAIFEITLSNGGRHECTLVTNYMDDFGKHAVTNKFDIRINNPELPLVPVIIVIVLAAAFYYFRIRKRKQ